MSQLNLLMLNYEFPPIGGGAANAHLALLKQYANRSNLKIDVLTSAPKPGFFKEKFSENITIYKVGLHKKDLHFWRKAEVIEWLFKAKSHYRKLLRENDYDLVHAFFGFPTGWLCYRRPFVARIQSLAARDTGLRLAKAGYVPAKAGHGRRVTERLPYIISLRGSDVPGRHARLQLDYKILAPVFKAIWKKAAALVACSEGLKRRALSFLPTVAIDVIPNGVEMDRFYPPQKKTDAVPTNDVPLRLLTVGRLSVIKRVEMLIDVVQILHEDGCHVYFTIVGGGAMEQQLRQIVSEKNLSDIVEITGRIEAEKMPEVYRKNDIFVSASLQEGMSNAMLEAMASGLPIVTTHCEGVEELIKDNGIVVEKAQPDQIAKAIENLSDDPETHKKMSVAARKQAETFSWSSVAEKYLKVYENIK